MSTRLHSLSGYSELCLAFGIAQSDFVSYPAAIQMKDISSFAFNVLTASLQDNLNKAAPERQTILVFAALIDYGGGADDSWNSTTCKPPAKSPPA